MNGIKQLGNEVVAAIKSYIDNKLDVFQVKFKIFEERMTTLKDGKDGRDGRDGRDGKDALQVSVIEGIDENITYSKGTFAAYKNGLFYATTETKGMEGWKCLISGISEIDVSISEDLRNVSVKTVKSNGEKIEKNFSVPTLIYRGVFDSTQKYTTGDSVTFGGSMWVSKKDNNEGKPGESEGWQLAVKRGSK